MIEVSEVVVHEAAEPDVVGDLRHADFLAGEDGAEIDLSPFVADAATVGDETWQGQATSYSIGR